jgi:hypothetical protein
MQRDCRRDWLFWERELIHLFEARRESIEYGKFIFEGCYGNIFPK